MARSKLLLLIVLFSNLALGDEFSPNEVIVKYKKKVIRTRSAVNALYDAIGVKEVHHYLGSMVGFEHLVLEETVKIDTALKTLSMNDAVEYVQPNYILRISPHTLAGQGRFSAPNVLKTLREPYLPRFQFLQDSQQDNSTSKPDLIGAPIEINPGVEDPFLGQLYGLVQIHAIEAWNISKGDKNFIVANIDTGIDYNHEDLALNIWRNPNPSNMNDIAGFDFIHNDGSPFDDNMHGTHTAGIIGAVGGNGIGISGVNQKVALMSLKAFNKDGSATTADAIRAIDYAVSHGAKVLNNSWGSPYSDGDQALKEAIERAKEKDVLFVAASGDSGENNDDPSEAAYPAAFDSDNIIAVAATDRHGSLEFYSNYGKMTTHLAAPGTEIYSTMPGNQYGVCSGTSMASPHVAGAAALLWSLHPSWNYKKVKDVLLKTVDQLPSLAKTTVTGGRLNVFKALSYTE